MLTPFVLPLIFLKYISDAFEEFHEELESKADEGMDSEEPDYYTANNVFWVPKEARWSTIQSQARQNTNGTTIDQAMTAIERDNSALRGVLPKDYGRDALDKQRLGEVIDLVSKGRGSRWQPGPDPGPHRPGPRPGNAGALHALGTQHYPETH